MNHNIHSNYVQDQIFITVPDQNTKNISCINTPLPYQDIHNVNSSPIGFSNGKGLLNNSQHMSNSTKNLQLTEPLSFNINNCTNTTNFNNHIPNVNFPQLNDYRNHSFTYQPNSISEKYFNEFNQPLDSSFQQPYSNNYVKENQFIRKDIPVHNNFPCNFLQTSESSNENLSSINTLSKLNLSSTKSEIQYLPSLPKVITSNSSISTTSTPNENKEKIDMINNSKSHSFEYVDNQQSHSFIGCNQLNITPSRRMINIMEERKLIHSTGIMIPIPNLLHITKKPNCCPSIMRCTMNSVPSSEDILTKTRLPLALMIHPFKDLANLQVIKSKKIIRCRTALCRTYLNPFVIFSDKKHWQCNLCQRMNELTEDCLYDESLGIYIETQKRAEIKLATVEYIAPKEYSMRSSPPPAYVFLFDISMNATYSLYPKTLNKIFSTISELLDRFPGKEYAKISIIGYDSKIHLYTVQERKCQEIIISDISSPIEIPTIDGILIDLYKYKEIIQELLISLLINIDNGSSPDNGSLSLPDQVPNCLGSALLVAKQIINKFGGRITIFNASRPTIGEGVLTIRDFKKTGTTFPFTPDKEFYKTLSLECAQAQIGVDLFQLGKEPCDLASLSLVSRYCGGSLFYYPSLTVKSLIKNFKENYKNKGDDENDEYILETQRLLYDLNRYITRKIGFDAVLRLRYSSGFSVQASYGNFFARACDLYAMANVNPDSGITVKLGISDGFIDSHAVFFQAALLYTSSHGERRIRVHTLCLPVSSQIDDVFRMADHQAVAVFLTKSVSDRLQSNGKVYDAREALLNAIVDPSVSFGECCLNSSQRLTSLPFPYHLRLLPLYVWGILQSECLLTSQNHLDQSTAILETWRNFPMSYILMDLYPYLYKITSVAYIRCKRKEKLNVLSECNDISECRFKENELKNNKLENDTDVSYSSDSENSSWDSDACSRDGGCDPKSIHSEDHHENMKDSESDQSDEEDLWFPEQLQLSLQCLKRSEVYLLACSYGLILVMGNDTPRTFFNEIFDVDSFSELLLNGPTIKLPELEKASSVQLRLFIKELQIEKPIGSHLFIINNNQSILNVIFQSHLIEDDKLNSSYHGFLKNIQKKVNR